MKLINTFLLYVLMTASASAIIVNVPNPEPEGYGDPAITQANLFKTVCVPGYSDSVRPPVSYTNDLKRKMIAERHLPGTLSNYEGDHERPISIGGHPTDPRNFWPQPWSGPDNANDKDTVEKAVHRALCQTRLFTLRQAVNCMKHWKTCKIPQPAKTRKRPKVLTPKPIPLKTKVLK